MERDAENDDDLLTFEPLAAATARVLVKSVQQRIIGATTFAAFDAVWLDAPRHFVGGREPAVSGGDGNKGPASIRAHRQGAAHAQTERCAGEELDHCAASPNKGSRASEAIKAAPGMT